jgi:ribosomal protein S6
MSLEKAKEILKKVQEGTATSEEKNLQQLAYSIVKQNMLSKLGV